jgi:hypothetical protein
MNRFLYAHANPATLIDPTGHAACLRFIDGVCQGYHSQVRTGTRTKAQVERDRATRNRQAEYGTTNRRSVMTGLSNREVKEVRAAARQVRYDQRNRAIQAARGSAAERADARMHSAGRYAWIEEDAARIARNDSTHLGPSMCGRNPGICAGVLAFGTAGLGALPALGTWAAQTIASAAATVSTAASTWFATGSAATACVAVDCVSKAQTAGNVLVELSGATAPGAAGALGGPVRFTVPHGASSATVASMRQYVEVAEQARLSGALSSTGRVSTAGALRLDANAAARLQRVEAAAAGRPYAGVVGHGPDTTWTGKAVPFRWLDMDALANASLGGQSGRYPVGYMPTIFELVEEGIG